MITQELIKQIFDYHPDGYLTWKSYDESKKRYVNIRMRGRRVGSSLTTDGYERIHLNKKSYGAHRLIFLFHHGWLPDEIDHIDNDRSHNRIENLRAATRAENGRNTVKRVTNTSGYKGVYWDQSQGRWRAQIYVDGKHIHLGGDSDKETCFRLYEKAARELHGEFASPEK